ncbi:hypothetical protein GLOTRDRAFT_126124 [Gloeophyllum trabeum ATCC 11539]|uniref:Uncharacterized protein n=1 Tax=Gloeophyllum trabeum (strain ATCC 11539 / FP-39264 / Madison 617) TaxID=670483 RepID=S7QKP6_GLOTA|nr:uncharacterized protein GLOTRDRAFT_126124 [Gloeophyllum trabeum ATCC 11539]EPQ59828.1 hypothetical protein GLOTRDRAFT_126124 [Gloeophyllum trabeum ATCC 11539]
MFFSFRLRTDQPVEGIPWPASLGNSLDSEPAVDPYAVNTPRGDPVKGIITKCMHAKLSSPILATWRYANSHNLVWFAIFTAPLPPSLTPIGSADIPRAGDIWICTRLGEEEVYWKDYNGIWQLWDDVYPFTHHPFIQQAILLAGSGNNLAAPRWMDARGNSSNGKSTLSRNGARKGHDVARHISLNLLRTSTEISLTQRRGARTGAHISRRGVKRGLSDVNGVEREVGMSQSGFTDFTYGAGLDSPSPRRPSDKPLALLDELPLPPFGEATDAATGTDDTNPIAVLYDYRATCHSNHIGLASHILVCAHPTVLIHLPSPQVASIS